MASTTTQRQALLSAVAALPTADDGSWSVPAPILKATSTSEADAKRHVLSFSAWAQGAVRQLPEASEHEATDFSDYYKIVMSRVQLVYAKATQPAGELRFPACRFQTQLRRRPQVVKDGAARELGVFDSGAGPEMVGSYEGSSAAFRAALQAVGERRFRAATLRRLFAARGPPAASIEESLAPVNEEWVRLLSGSRLFELLDDGVGFSASGGVQVRVELQGGQAVVLAQGPWFRVTFAETPILQCMAQFMTEAVQTEGDHGAARWCRDALMNFAVAAHSVQERVHAPGLGSVSFFAGRRAPHADFHLLQHLYLQQLWPAFATSSLFAGRVLPRCRLVGTSAHEGPMALMALEARDGPRSPEIRREHRA